MSLADHKGTQRGSLDTYSFLRVCGEVIRLLLKYCIHCVSAPSLHRESTDSLILVCLLQHLGESIVTDSKGVKSLELTK